MEAQACLRASDFQAGIFAYFDIVSKRRRTAAVVIGQRSLKPRSRVRHPTKNITRKEKYFPPAYRVFCYNLAYAEANLAWWPAWTSNPVGIRREPGSVGSIPIRLRHYLSKPIQNIQ